MNSQHAERETPGIDVHEILFVLFRHKWKVIVLTLLGLIAAGGVYLAGARYFQSDSKLLIRYVIDRSSVDEMAPSMDTAGRSGDSLIAAEAEILSSWDLAVQVAETVGPARILAGTEDGASLEKAATAVAQGLEIVSKKGSNVIAVSYRSRNPEIVQPVLEEFVRQYFEKHLQVHRSQQAFDFVSAQRDAVKERMNDLQDKLTKLKDGAGISSLTESRTTLHSQIATIQESIMSAEASFSEQKARFTHLAGSHQSPAATESAATPTPSSAVPPDQLEQYQALGAQLISLRRTEGELLAKYTPASSIVFSNRAQVRGVEEQRAALRKKYPALGSVVESAAKPGTTIDLLSEQANLVAAEAKLSTLKQQLEQLRATDAKINAVAAQIEDLERQKAIEEKTYAEFQSKLESQRVSEALDPSKIPNISVVQKPTPPAIVLGKTKKVVLGVGAGGLLLGLSSALCLGLLLDGTIKRPAELESRLGIPLMLQIPAIGRLKNRSKRRKGERAEPSDTRSVDLVSHGTGAPWSAGHFIRPFAEIIRDRLILGFELKRITHKPKLIAVTGLSGGEGASTLAGGLAAVLSETDHGKVLLVDMTSDNPEMRPFVEGRSSAALMDAIHANGNGITPAENLYLATGEASGSNQRMIAPRRFYELIPTLRASHFDYIIFDMPPMQTGSATLAISGFMDKVLLVVQPEHSNRAALRRTYSELVAAKADVSAVVNKGRRDVPGWLLS